MRGGPPRRSHTRGNTAVYRKRLCLTYHRTVVALVFRREVRDRFRHTWPEQQLALLEVTLVAVPQQILVPGGQSNRRVTAGRFWSVFAIGKICIIIKRQGIRFLLGVTRMDNIRNEYIRGTAQVGRFGEKVREARLRRFWTCTEERCWV